MEENKKIAVVGGDLRQLKMAGCLSLSGYDVNIFGFDQVYFALGNKVKKYDSLEETLSNVDVTILGLPCSVDDETLNAPLYSNKIYLKEFLKAFDKNSLLIGGRISEKVHNIIKVHGMYAIDYFEREELQILNAIPRA